MKKLHIVLLALVLLGGCAGEVVRRPVESPVAEGGSVKKFVTVEATSVRLDSGYERTIKRGTEFLQTGSIQQGKVLKPINTVFTVEGAHAHEAYPVLHDGHIVGFYLPVEHAFSPLSQVVRLSLQERNP